MAGREISSTLKNLKFMQRAAVKDEKKKEDEEVMSNGVFGFSPAISKKCVVIMEGDPHPRAVKGRMSFQSFNPSIDKLAEELENRSKDPGESKPSRQNGSSGNAEGNLNEDSDMSDSKKAHKRKQPVMESEESQETQYPNKSPKNVHDNQQARASSSKKKNSKNKKKHEKNNWSVLRPPKSQGRS